MNKIVIFITIMLLSVTGKAQENTFIPQPESVLFKNGVFNLSNTTKIYMPKQVASSFKPYVLEKLKFETGLDFVVETGKVKIKSNYIEFQKTKDKSVKEEGYILEVSDSKIIVKAKGFSGFFNGFQTLRQIVPIEKTSEIKLPNVTIIDNPRFGWRGVLMDVSRHFHSKEFVMKQIDLLSSYKINVFHLHLTDDQGWRVEIKKYPKLTEKGAWRAERDDHWWGRKPATAKEPKTVGGFYTQDVLKEIIAFAKTRNVEIIPEIDVPGHSKALVASYPELFCSDIDTTGVNFEVAVGGKAPNNTVCPASEFTYEFLEGVIEEIADVFPSKYLHIGGDECSKKDWKKSAMCAALMEENGLKDYEELQSYFIQRIHKIVEKQNKTMIGWDEVLSGNGVPGATIMAWRRGKYNPEVQAPREGYPTIMTSYLHSYISRVQGPTFMEPEGPNSVLPLSVVYNHEPVPAELTKEEAARVLGNQASLWGEFTPTGEHFEYMLYPRTLASAEVSWSNPKVKSWERFQKALEFKHFNRLKKEGVNVARSLFTVYPAFGIDQLHNKAIVYLETEAVGYDIYYTLDGSDPTMEATKYTENFKAVPKSLLKAGLFNKKGELLGEITEIRLK
ncbi:hexosaminidase [Maribacter dokdonensis]|uniref:beta-N-acetylhexosaminidase n=1 Tax=Maribacter dokdonensis TaxID=320912 RepID=A0A1H4UVH1_9FLAO|nr:family 20 glycosylhydrolase [Maribacter dokdonensis]SEC72418.1 hexosaminidase [Maribacter dokdonensis]